MKSLLEFLFYVGLLLFTADVSGFITENSLNAVTEVGQQAIFNCTSDTTQQNWVFSAKREDLGTPSVQSIVLSCVVQPGFSTHYDVDRPGGSNKKCNLIVKASTTQQAGVYTCTDSTTGPSAILTVIDRDTSITVMNSSGVVAGDNVTMSYTVRYNTSTASSQTPTIQPVLTWTDSDGKIVNTPGTNSLTSSMSITAGRRAIQPHTCRISYQINGSTTMFASNTPNSISTSPPTPIIDVSYAPDIPSIRMSDEVPECPGDTVTLTCVATANPPATYSWIGPNSLNSSGATIVANMNGYYTCTASNVMQGITRSETNETTINVFSANASAEDCTENGQKPPMDEDCQVIIIVCSAIGAYILGNIIATVVFLICYKRNIGFKMKLNDRFSWLRKMLPCMNENVSCGCGWIFLSVCVFTLVGILFIIWMIVIENCCCCSQGRRRSEATVKHFHNPSDYPGPDDDDDPYGKINIGIHSASQDNTRKGKGKKMQQNGKKKRNEKSTDERKNQPPPNVDNRTADPSSSPPIPPNDAPQHQQSTSAQGTVYSELPVTNLNIQPQQFIEGNNDASNYGELKKT